MQIQKENPRPFEFYLRELDNHVLVEATPRGVVIRATRDNCSDRRKAFFVRKIITEGYIPHCYQAGTALQTDHPVEWIVDDSWEKRLPRA